MSILYLLLVKEEDDLLLAQEKDLIVQRPKAQVSARWREGRRQLDIYIYIYISLGIPIGPLKEGEQQQALGRSWPLLVTYWLVLEGEQPQALGRSCQ